jgi:hopanoid biosynthesis associated protein HpnK
MGRGREGSSMNRSATSGCRLIVNADDFGLSAAANDGVLLAHRQGIVTSASVMAGASAFETAAAQARATPSLDLGVHLMLTDGRPVADPGTIRSLVTRHGGFHGHALVLTRRLLTGRIHLGEVRAELTAQIERVRAAGLPISHVDGHQHVHVLPGIWPIVRELACRFAIPAVRLPRERFRRSMVSAGFSSLRVVQMLALGLFARACRPEGLRVPDHWVGFAVGGRLDAVALAAILRDLPASGTCELMCHPGLGTDDSRRGAGYDPEAEVAALTAPAVRTLLAERGIRLTSWRELAAGR